MVILVQSKYQILAEQTNLIFWSKLAQNRKSEHQYRILHIQISLGTNAVDIERRFNVDTTSCVYWEVLLQRIYLTLSCIML